MGHAQRAILPGHALHRDHRVFHPTIPMEWSVGNSIDETGVGAVFEKPPHGLKSFGHTVRLMSPQFVKPCVKSNNIDVANAKASPPSVATATGTKP